MVPSAYLRVFQPLGSFEQAEREHWERYVVEGRHRHRGRPRYVDRQTAPGLGMLAPAGGEQAEVRLIDGKPYVSPHRIRLRILAAMLSFREAEAIEFWDRFVPKREAKRARRQLQRHRRRDPHAVVFSHQSPWHVPLRWFALFRDEERRLGDDAFGRLRLRYVTPATRAIRRAENAIPILRRSDLEPISELLLDLHQWLLEFDRGSVLELDYGELCDFMTWDELDNDHSARGIQDALDALSRLEYLQAADTYQGVLAHWAEVRSRELMN